MDKLILGILMLKRLTSYEIRNIIRQSYKSMCSDSLGTIQATLKKLFESGLVTYNEFVEKSVNKKVYSITDAGREFYMEWLKTPTDTSKAKNMEIGKLLMMGLVPEGEREALIERSIAILNSELLYLQEVQKNADIEESGRHILSWLKQDHEYSVGITTAANNSNIAETVDAISEFQTITLQFGIDMAKFQIEWFTKLKEKVASIHPAAN